MNWFWVYLKINKPIGWFYGTIKFHHLNKDRPHTQKEMQKMDRCRDYLKDNGVFDADSFYEFLNEQQWQIKINLFNWFQERTIGH